MRDCSKCGKENITFNKDWVCVDCMSEQLLGGLDRDAPPSSDPKAQYLLAHGWEFSYAHFKHGGWKYQEGTGSYHTEDLDGAFEKQKGMEGVALWESVQNGDMVNNPPHYNQFPVEVIDIIEWYFPNNYHLGNATKYLLRSAYKGHEIEDLRKLVWYVERYIESKEGHANTVPDLPSEQGDS